ncbi:GLPGLI family protein [Rhizosphaericola mali]|uniref:GLPGLI family protein n=1 Tax=Rhizosphaericola mali TaxID=2545455 RepID=A0A5P2G657_9BACT|nr:GLPGLI family protein [Rhizosphaericola mali]QES89382.1 GLPGLI family protein [Rhizosphaericola mali]
MRTYLLLLLFSLNSIHLFAQNQKEIKFDYRAKYNLKYRLDSTSKHISQTQFILFFNNEQSYFRSFQRYAWDSVENTTMKNASLQEKMGVMMKYYSDFIYNITTFPANNEVLYKEDILYVPTHDIHTEYKENFKIHWKISNEAKKIKNFNCTKAECNLFGRHWTAWFSIDHPFPFGPYKFYGLPGLIISLEDDAKDYQFNLYYLSPENYTFKDNSDAKPLLVTKKEFLNMYEEYNYTSKKEDGVHYVDPKDSIKFTSPEYYKKLKMQRSNALELKPFSY